jgi:hypothetical protein
VYGLRSVDVVPVAVNRHGVRGQRWSDAAGTCHDPGSWGDVRQFDKVLDLCIDRRADRYSLNLLLTVTTVRNGKVPSSTGEGST